MSTIDTYYDGPGGFPTINKSPTATLDYPFDWSAWLTLISDTIASVVWTLDPSLTKVSSSFTSMVATAFISGGTVNTVVPVVCQITTAGGRIDERTIQLKIIER